MTAEVAYSMLAFAFGTAMVWLLLYMLSFGRGGR